MRAGERLDHDRLHGQRSRKAKVLFHNFLIHIILIVLALTGFFSCTPGSHYTDSHGNVVDKRAAEHYNQGNAYYKKGEYDLAISEYTKAMEILPRVDFYYGRGLSYLGKSQYDQAISDFTKAIEIDPKDASAYRNRASSYVGKSQYDQAISDVTKAIEIDPKDAGTYAGRGVLYCQKGQIDLGISDLNNARKLDPNLKGVDEAIALCKSKQKKAVPKSPSRK